MTQEQQEFVLQLSEKCSTYDQWKTVVAFGLETLLKDQYFLIEIIWRRALAESKGEDPVNACDRVNRILTDLKLKLST